MLHSGSRNIGKQVADKYDKIAKELNERYFSIVPKEHDLAFLNINTQEGQEYLNDMNFCLDFAYYNRLTMMNIIKDIFTYEYPETIFKDIINIHHNYARLENHYGENVIVHRKGATSARLSEIGLIPGSQGTKSYVVKGKGNLESFMSCSHGAGRQLGRKQAQRELNLENEQKKLNDLGIIHSIRNVSDLDEASGAYKDIETVIANQSDCVDIIEELSPLAVIKG